MMGGCTTYIATIIIKSLMDSYDIIGYPRLVRLNPNIPWKTRGNGAISIQIGEGNGEKIKIGEIEGEDVLASKRSIGDLKDSDYKEIKRKVKKMVDEHARLEDENTNPGFVIARKKPNFEVYKKAVTQIISLNEIESILRELEAEYCGYKNQRGLIGATSAIAWSPIDKTYELISYRKKQRWGTKRFVDEDSVKRMDKECEYTFDNYDYKNKHNRLVPNSPCPVLYGIRSDNNKNLFSAFNYIKSEPVESWIIFETNQGTDDHLQRKKIEEVRPYQSVVVEGSVDRDPFTIPGGHVIFKLKDSTGEIDCAAYEPTKEFRNVVRGLVKGDVVEVYGSIREKPLTINIEKLRVKFLKKQIKKVENPICPHCKKHMKSRGANQGYKCKRCGTKSLTPFFKEEKRSLAPGFYEVPVCARRHLSKPLKRMNHKSF
jgi:tRNA(Ile2)-agmatinylcytidine synthase